MVTTPYNRVPEIYSTKKDYFPSVLQGIPKNAFILRKGSTDNVQIYPYILTELPKDGVFRLYNSGTLNVTTGIYYIPGIYIIHKDYSTTLYNAVNFKLEVNAVLKSGGYLEYTDIDFSDCIMIGIGVGQAQYFD